MSNLFQEVTVGPSQWAREQGGLVCENVTVQIGRVDLDDEECPECNNQKDILKIKSYMEDVALAIIYHCPCAHIWHKDLQGEEDETTEKEGPVDQEEEVPDKAIDSTSNS